MGDILVVALNSDSSLKKLKGAGRALIDEAGRVRIISALACVDYVTLFAEADGRTRAAGHHPPFSLQGLRLYAGFHPGAGHRPQLRRADGHRRRRQGPLHFAGDPEDQGIVRLNWNHRHYPLVLAGRHRAYPAGFPGPAPGLSRRPHQLDRRAGRSRAAGEFPGHRPGPGLRSEIPARLAGPDSVPGRLRAPLARGNSTWCSISRD